MNHGGQKAYNIYIYIYTLYHNNTRSIKCAYSELHNIDISSNISVI